MRFCNDFDSNVQASKQQGEIEQSSLIKLFMR
jgi:hypothetical protein